MQKQQQGFLPPGRNRTNKRKRGGKKRGEGRADPVNPEGEGKAASGRSGGSKKSVGTRDSPILTNGKVLRK